MLPVYLGIYIFFLAVLWGFFLVARHHNQKFQDFSSTIVPVTRVLFLFLLSLSILGFFLLFTLDTSLNLVELDETQPSQTLYY